MDQNEWKKRLDELQRALTQARKGYDLAKREYEQAQELLRGLGGFGSPDGVTSTRKAQERYFLAFEQYRDAVSDYTEFLLGESD
jgi:hypothetical protein